MSGNEIVNYNRQNVDTNRTGGRTGSDAGGSSGGQYGEAHESAAVTQLKAKIAGITRLAKRTNAHTSLVKANCAA